MFGVIRRPRAKGSPGTQRALRQPSLAHVTGACDVRTTAHDPGAVKLLRLVGRWEDASVAPWAELVLGCVLLVVSWSWFWESSGAIWDTWRKAVGAVAVVLGPWLIHRGWTRRRTTYVPWPPRPDETESEAIERISSELTVACVTCFERAELVGMPDKHLGFLGYAVLCPRCGVYLLERVDPE